MDHALTSMASNIKLPLWGAKHVLVSGQLRKTEVRAIDFALPSVIQISNARRQVSETWLHFAAVEATWLAHYYQTHGLEFRWPFLNLTSLRITVMNATYARGGARDLVMEYISWSMNCLSVSTFAEPQALYQLTP